LLLLCGRFDDAAEAAAAAAAAGGRDVSAKRRNSAAAALRASAAEALRSAASARRALAAGRAAVAESAASAALEAAPQSASLRLLRGRAALALGRLHWALRDAAAALRCGSGASPAPLLLLADAYAALLPAREGLAAAEQALAACLRGAPGEAACSAAHGATRALRRAWAAADAAPELAPRSALLADVVALAAASQHSASEAAAAGALCTLLATHARAAAGAGADDAARWCGDALAAAARERQRGAPGASAASASAALHRAWAHLSRCRGDGDAMDGLADAAACVAAAAADAAAARAHAALAQAEDASVDGAAEALSAALRELDAAIAAVAAASQPPDGGPDDFYALLNVSRADADSLPPAAWSSLLRRAYRRAALTWHPDKWSADDAVAAAAASARFVRLAEAYRTLADAALRAAYDAAAGLAGGSMRVGDGASMSFGTPESAGARGGWQFRYDKRDVDERGFAVGVWEHAASGARRRGERDTRPAAAHGGRGMDPCAPGGVAARRCLPGTAPPPRPDGAAKPLRPPPALRGPAVSRGAACEASLVRNHFDLQSLRLDFAMPAPGAVLTWRAPALRGVRFAPHDELSYEIKWLAVTPDGADAQSDADQAEEADAPPPAAFVALDVLLAGGRGALLGPRGAVDGWGLASSPETDLRDAMARHGAAGWLERRIRVPASADGGDEGGMEADALLFACAHAGGASVRAAVRDVRLFGPDGGLKAILLDGNAPETDE
jgi:hypothetical protein